MVRSSAIMGIDGGGRTFRGFRTVKSNIKPWKIPNAFLLWCNNPMNEADKTFDIPRLKSKISKDLFSIISSGHITLNLKGKTKETVIRELLDILSTQGKLIDRAIVLNDLETVNK
jgi:hypothetical protein